MKKIKKLLIIVFILIIVTLTAFYIFKKIDDKRPKSLLDFYFEDKEQEYIKDLLYKDNSSITIDDYTITLKEVLMESTVDMVYCKFEVTRNGKDMRKENFVKTTDTFRVRFGEDYRFSFFLDYEKNMDYPYYEYRVTKEKLYIYCKFSLQPTKNDITIYLYDINSGKEEERLAENSSGEFHINNKNEKSKTYYYKDEKIEITPFRFVVRGEKGIFCGKLEIFYKDKSSLLVKEGDDCYGVKNITFGSSPENSYGSGYSNEWYCDLEFKKPIDVESIDYICVSGNRLE